MCSPSSATEMVVQLLELGTPRKQQATEAWAKAGSGSLQVA